MIVRFPEDQGGGASLADMLNSFDSTPADGSDPNVDPTTDPAPDPALTTEPEPEPAPPPEDKATKAFAAMRVENGQLRSQYEQTLGLLTKVAKAMGIEGNDPTEITSKLNDDAINKLAQKDNIPVEYLKRMEALESMNARVMRQEREQKTRQDFQTLSDTYGLSKDDLIAFAGELDTAKINPMEQDVDIVAHYRNSHFDVILQKEVQKALLRDNNAGTHSSKPNNHRGVGGTEPEKIGTVAGLRSILNDIR